MEPGIYLTTLAAFAAGLGAGWWLRGHPAAPVASEGVTEAQPNTLSSHDRDLARLVGMGFRAEEVRPLLTKARMKGDPDPYGYVMRALVR